MILKTEKNIWLIVVAKAAILISIIFETLFYMTVHFKILTKINYFTPILFVFIITSLIIELLKTCHK